MQFSETQDLFNSSLSRIQLVLRRVEFPNDTFYLLVALLVSNYLRLFFDSLPLDIVFGVIGLVVGASLLRDGLPRVVWPVVAAFAGLLVVYGIGILFDFGYQGMRHVAGILFGGILFLFCYRNVAELIRHKYIIPLFVIAVLGLFLVYVTPAGFNPNLFISMFSYLLLTIGLILLVRADSKMARFVLVHVVLGIVVAGGLVYGYRSLITALILAYPMYWAGYLFLKNRIGASVLSIAAGLFVALIIALYGTEFMDSRLTEWDSWARKYVGGRILTGRETLWRASLNAITESRLLGRGAGTVIIDLLLEENAPVANNVTVRECLNTAVVPDVERNFGLANDCSVLLSVKDRLSGGVDLNWSTSIYIGDWDGVEVTGIPGRVTTMRLPHYGLRGEIPPELGNLDRLVAIRLNNNELTGEIPPELGNLANLNRLVLNVNSLSGSVPPELGNLTKLQELWIKQNNLSGQIPPELGNLSNLSVLRLVENDFTGCVPIELRSVPDHQLDASALPNCDMSFTVTDRPTATVAVAESADTTQGVAGSGSASQSNNAGQSGIDAAANETDTDRLLPESVPAQGAGQTELGSIINRVNELVDSSSAPPAPVSAHNLFLQVGVQTGILGMVALALLCGVLIFNLVVPKGGRVDSVQCFVATCTLMVIIHSTFEVFLLQNIFILGAVTWILMGIGAGIVHARQQQQNEQEEASVHVPESLDDDSADVSSASAA